MPATAKSIADVRYGEVPASYSPEEWRTRVGLAACYRIIHHFGWTSQVYNHLRAGSRRRMISAGIPGSTA